MRTFRLLPVLLPILPPMLLLACAPPPPTRAQVIAYAAKAEPDEARLAGLYDQSCRTCHANPDSGAPLTGDRAAWVPRLDQGRATLMNSIIAGKNAMPAGGQCVTCTPDDYWALVHFMTKPPAL